MLVFCVEHFLSSILFDWMQIITSFTGYNATHASTLCVKCMEILKYSGSELIGSVCKLLRWSASRLSVWVEQSSANKGKNSVLAPQLKRRCRPGFYFQRPHFQESEASPSLSLYTAGRFVLTVWISPTFLVSLRMQMDQGEFTLQETEMLLNVIHSCVWHRRHFMFFSKLFWRTG